MFQTTNQRWFDTHDQRCGVLNVMCGVLNGWKHNYVTRIQTGTSSAKALFWCVDWPIGVSPPGEKALTSNLHRAERSSEGSATGSADWKYDIGLRVICWMLHRILVFTLLGLFFGRCEVAKFAESLQMFLHFGPLLKSDVPWYQLMAGSSCSSCWWINHLRLLPREIPMCRFKKNPAEIQAKWLLKDT